MSANSTAIRPLGVFLGMMAGAILFSPAFLFADSSSDNGTHVTINLNDHDLPANDLTYDDHGNTRILTPIEAQELKSSTTNPIDLSMLEPDATSDIWKGEATAATDDAKIEIESGDEVAYQGAITSSALRFRFDVQTAPQNLQPKTFAILLSKDVHTFLLRKNLLRKLGYQVPGMKWLSQLKVKFPDIATRDLVIKTLIPNSTLGTPLRWITDPKLDPAHGLAPIGDANALEYTFQDVIAMEATPLYYNLALGPPIQGGLSSGYIYPEGPRVLRALAFPYGLADVPESVNQFDWYLGRKDGNVFSFDVPDQANFSCTLDDALWILRKISRLTREDFSEIVQDANYPNAVESVIIEKLISRRDSLMKSFKTDTLKLGAQPNISSGQELKNGKLLKKEWPGYASNFSYGDAESPLAQLKYYFISEAESNLMSNLVNAANRQLPSLTVSSQEASHQMGQALSSNQPHGIRLGVWAGPLISGGVDFSRTVVMGNYLGTNNLIQLVDNFGFHKSAGLIIGVQGLPLNLGFDGVAQGSVSVSVTHVKPLANLKTAVTEPIREAFVPWVFQKASTVLNEVSKLKDKSLTSSEVKQNITNDLKELQKYLGIGESLLRTESISGNQSLAVSVSAPVALAPGVSLQLGKNELVISRLHIFRKDANTIQVFKDSGELSGVSVSCEFTVLSPISFPVLTITAQNVSGTAKTKLFTVNINPDPVINPSIYLNAAALTAAVRAGSTEVLQAAQNPAKIAVDFHDSASSVQFFDNFKRSLRTSGRTQIELPDGAKGDFLSITDGRQTGKNFQSFAGQVGTFLVQKLTGSNSLSIDTGASLNGGQSFLGHSQTRTMEFQSRLNAGKIVSPFLRIQYRWQGWSISKSDTLRLTDSLSTKFGFQLYPDGFLGDARDYKLYQLSVSINLYPSAITAVLTTDPQFQSEMEEGYRDLYECGQYIIQNIHCAEIRTYHNLLSQYRRDSGHIDPTAQSQMVFKIVDSLEKFTSFGDFVKMAGGEKGLYVSSVITGFREGSETVSTPIYSNSLGHSDPDNPGGVLDTVQQILGIGSGEFEMQWMRDFL